MIGTRTRNSPGGSIGDTYVYVTPDEIAQLETGMIKGQWVNQFEDGMTLATLTAQIKPDEDWQKIPIIGEPEGLGPYDHVSMFLSSPAYRELKPNHSTADHQGPGGHVYVFTPDKVPHNLYLDDDYQQLTEIVARLRR